MSKPTLINQVADQYFNNKSEENYELLGKTTYEYLYKVVNKKLSRKSPPLLKYRIQDNKKDLIQKWFEGDYLNKFKQGSSKCKFSTWCYTSFTKFVLYYETNKVSKDMSIPLPLMDDSWNKNQRKKNKAIELIHYKNWKKHRKEFEKKLNRVEFEDDLKIVEQSLENNPELKQFFKSIQDYRLGIKKRLPNRSKDKKNLLNNLTEKELESFNNLIDNKELFNLLEENKCL